MKHAIKDRHTQAFGLFFVGIILLILLRKQGKAWIVGVLAAAGGLGYFAWLLFRPGRVVLLDRAPDFQIYMMKPAGECKFTEDWPEVVDGILHPDGRLFKVGKGVDVIVKDKEIKPAGPGSAIVNAITGNGYLKTVPNNECWKLLWAGQGTVIDTGAPVSTPEDLP